MQFKVVVRVVGVLLSLFSVTMFVPILVSLLYRDGATLPFVYAFLVTLATGLCCWIPLRKEPMRLRLRDNFVVVVMFWTVLGLFGALPLYLYTPMSLTIGQSIFESMSGFTTTGATVIVELDKQPESILFYRQFVQWLGGMGIVVLAVAILPLMGFVGGTQLFRAETSGPQTDKLTPRIGETAKVLWIIYLFLTALCALAYWLAGMSVFDAVGHSFSTVAIGGFSTHDASIGYFQSTAIEMIAVVFMLISAVSFTLHYLALRDVVFKHERERERFALKKKWRLPRLENMPDLREFTIKPYRTDPEFKAFVLLIFALCTIVVAYLYLTNTASFEKSFFHGVFQVVSIATTTGFTTAEYFNWPGFLPVLLLFASFVGGCAGSTGGGMKVIRVLLLFKQGVRELVRIVHPNATIPVKLGKKVVPSRTIDSVWGFFAAYVVILALMLLALMATGLDQETAFSAVVACLNNLGPGLGDVGANYSSLDSVQLLVLCGAMLLGRLEIFTLLVILTPHFWRK